MQKKSTKNGTTKSEKVQVIAKESSCARFAKANPINDATDAAHFAKLAAQDVALGNLTPQVSSAISAALGKALKATELTERYGSFNSNGKKSLAIGHKVERPKQLSALKGA